ncbi:MAG: hypothetical protein OEQ53_01495 [Saprospiraceae bacterium]|nr:hypothetical protein [Saprospiraceae bacterium]
MKAATVKVIKDELKGRSSHELIAICLRLAKFKKENKELLTYLLFEAANEFNYTAGIKTEVDEQFEQINTSSYYYIKKSIRKILRNLKRQIRYSQRKETEIELLLYFCTKLKHLQPSIHSNKVLKNMYIRQIALVRKRILLLHEDLQYDYGLLLEEL